MRKIRTFKVDEIDTRLEQAQSTPTYNQDNQYICFKFKINLNFYLYLLSY